MSDYADFETAADRAAATNNREISGDELRITNPSYAAYLETTAGKILFEQAQQIATLTARVAEMREWIEAACEDADVFKHEGKPMLVSMGPWSPDFYAKGLRLSKQPDADGGSQT